MKGKEVKKGDLGEDEVTVPCSHVVQGGASVEKRRRARDEGHRQNRKKDRITIIEGGGIEEEFCVELEEGLCVISPVWQGGRLCRVS